MSLFGLLLTALCIYKDGFSVYAARQSKWQSNRKHFIKVLGSLCFILLPFKYVFPALYKAHSLLTLFYDFFSLILCLSECKLRDEFVAVVSRITFFYTISKPRDIKSDNSTAFFSVCVIGTNRHIHSTLELDLYNSILKVHFICTFYLC